MAFATWTPTSRTSSLNVNANGATGASLVTNFNPYTDTIARASLGANVSASQTSSITSNQVSVSSIVNVRSYSLGGASGSFGQGTGSSIFQLDFTTTGGMNYALLGTKSGLPGIHTITLKNLTTNAFVFIVDGSSPDSYSRSGLLADANYRLELSISHSASAGFSDEGRLDATFTFVPAPSSLAMLGLCGLATCRRRR